MRSTLRDWLGDKTEVPREVAEQILAHTVGGVEGAYRRGNAIEKRKAALQLWANYLSGGDRLMADWAAFVASGRSDMLAG